MLFNRIIKVKLNCLTKMKRSASKISVSSTSSNDEGSVLINKLAEERKDTAKSIMEYDFKNKRAQILSETKEVPENSGGVLYWMFRDCRVQDNWAMLYAQKLALKNKIPFYVLFSLPPTFQEYTLRHYKFWLKGLEEVENECRQLNIAFHIRPGMPSGVVADFVKEHNIGAVVSDFMPLHLPMEWQLSVVDQIPLNVPFVRVDAHNIVPCWVASDKQEYAARTIRNKINSQLVKYLKPYPPVIKHPYNPRSTKKIDWANLLKQCSVDSTVDEVKWSVPGYKAGINMLASFCKKRLQHFASKRNDPTQDALSNLSPWLHFGHLSAQRCVLVVRELKSKYTESVNSYCEEVIIRRELSDNFCYYNDKYNCLEGAPSWAQETLKIHRKDKRTHVYTIEELEQAKTHEDLWNSAQLELVQSGKLHGFMRMYWAKKILEWTDSPETALKAALRFNDRYALDGNDPNGYVGVMWSICGVHDQGWRERDVFGKIRYMNYAGCKRKFDVGAYVARWGGKEHPYKKKKTA